MMRSLRWLAVAAVAAGVAVGASAQSGEPVCSLGGSGTPSFGGYGAGKAYTLRAKSSFEQKLADGSYVRGYVRTTAGRDGEGRTLSQFPHGCYRGEDGQLKLKYSVHVFDPATKSTLSWQVGPDADKVASGARAADYVPRPTRQFTEADLAELRRAAPAESEYKAEDLGTRTIAGIEAHGTRRTRTIPVGEEGNELPLVTVTETWRAEKSGMTMMTINDDPRRGKTTYEVEEVTWGEPDASLFTPPADYKVEYRKTVVVDAGTPETAHVEGVMASH